MKQIKMMAVLLLMTIGAFAGVEKPKVIEKEKLLQVNWYYSTQSCYPVYGDSNHPVYYVRVTRTFEVDHWNHVTLLGTHSEESSTPCGINAPIQP